MNAPRGYMQKAVFKNYTDSLLFANVIFSRKQVLHLRVATFTGLSITVADSSCISTIIQPPLYLMLLKPRLESSHLLRQY
uniref:Uncharacterized protein n=1 Tax=Romanomermis culicivorax TaxID=13658 RepID=A0A915L5G1_ROMCU